MNSKDAIDRIKKLLFGEETFGTHKTKEGVEMTVEGDVELGKEIYIVTPDGNIPAGEGDYEMEDGMKVKVKEGMIEKIDYDGAEAEIEVEEEETMEDEKEEDMGYDDKEEEKMVKAELIDGTIVESDTDELKVGDALFVVTEEGRTAAPSGEHETTEGNIVVVEDGIITEIKEKVEEVVEEMATEETESFDELLEVFTAGFNHLSSELNVMREEYDKLREDFQKFSAEPAGERQFFNTQDYAKTKNAKKVEKLNALRALKLNK